MTRQIIGLGLHSAAIIAFQLSLMQLISIVQWHHFAYMIISIAMLGFGASGTLLALFREKLLSASGWLVPILMTASGFFMITAFQVTRLEVFQFDVYLLFVERSQFPVLAANYLIYFIPFFTGALAIGILFIKNATQIGTYYFSNLLGSGIGGLIVLFMFGSVYPQQVPPLIGLFSVGAGILSSGRRLIAPNISLGVVSVIIAAYLIYQPARIETSQYKGIAQAMNLPEAEIVYSKPDIHGLIQVAASPALRFAPALSLSYTGEVPVKKNIFVNGNFFGVIPQFREGQDSHILDYTTQILPWKLAKKDNVLMLDAGDGASLAQAMSHGAAHIDAVIDNGGVVQMMKTDFAGQSGGLYLQENLDIHVLEARNYLASVKDREYDIIMLPQQESFGGSAGINALQENYTMTLESFGLMWEMLSPGGMIAISTWTDYPPRTSLRILATLVETARNKGVAEPSRHLAAIRSWGNISYILKKQPLTPKDIEITRQLCEDLFFDPLILPGISPGERQSYHMSDDDEFFANVDRILAGDKSFLEDYSFLISPATDNKPYFSQFLRLGNIRELSGIYSTDQIPFLELGYLIVVVTLLQGTLLAFIFIILPLMKLRRSHRGKGGTLIYFGALGVGYMFVEIILIQRFVLYFGHPVYALSAVISTMLIASGAGSLTSGRLRAIARYPASIGLIITLMLLFYTFFLTPLLQESISSPLPVKIAVSLLLIGIPSFFKGFMFPLGIRYLASYDTSQTPWAWGINGSLSVISTSLAMLIAVETGFMAVMGVAVVCYAIAAAVFAFSRLFFRQKTTR